MTQSQDWFPGADYPDREVWLAIRSTPKTGPFAIRKRVVRWVTRHHGAYHAPLDLGLNRAKAGLDLRMQQMAIDIARQNGDTTSDIVKRPAKRGARQILVRQRHAYYRRATP